MTGRSDDDVAAGIRGYGLAPLNVFQRLVVFCSGLLLIAPGIYPPLIGLAAAAAVTAPGLLRARGMEHG